MLTIKCFHHYRFMTKQLHTILGRSAYSINLTVNSWLSWFDHRIRVCVVLNGPGSSKIQAINFVPRNVALHSVVLSISFPHNHWETNRIKKGCPAFIKKKLEKTYILRTRNILISHFITLHSYLCTRSYNE